MRKVNTTDIRNFTIRILFVGILVLPIQLVIFFFAAGMIGLVYEIIHQEVLGIHFPWGIVVDIRRVVEFLLTAFGIHIIYTLIYSILSFVIRKKADYYLLGILVVAVLFSVLVFDIGSPRITGFPVLLDLEYHVANSFLFAMLMFASFVKSMQLFDRKTEWQKWKKVLLSFVSSTVFGSILSFFVWVILFWIFHG